MHDTYLLTYLLRHLVILPANLPGVVWSRL